MAWPQPDEYDRAVQNPQTSFEDPDLRACKVVTNQIGLPKVATGNFASVYEFRTAQQRFAVRCFTHEVTDQNRRYDLLSSHLAGFASPYLVGFSFLEHGIRLGRNWYPIVKMDWVEGLPLHAVVEKMLPFAGDLLNLAKQLRGLTGTLHGLNMAHGDLQHGNILVTAEDALRLVDYDGMFVPRMKGENSPEKGHANFQHPLRTERHFDGTLDNFPAFLIFLSLRALAADRGFWKYHNGDNLILTGASLRDLEHAQAFKDLKSCRDPVVPRLADELRRFCLIDPSQVPSLEDILASIPADSLFPKQLVNYRRQKAAGPPPTSKTPSPSPKSPPPPPPKTPPPPPKPPPLPPKPAHLGPLPACQLGARAIGAAIHHRMTLINDGELDLDATLSAPGWINLSARHVRVAPGKSTTVDLHVQCTRLGETLGEIQIASTGGNQRVPVILEGHKPVPGKLVLDQNQVHLGKVDPKEHPKFAVKLRNSGDLPIEIEICHSILSWIQPDCTQVRLEGQQERTIAFTLQVKGRVRDCTEYREMLDLRLGADHYVETLEVRLLIWKQPGLFLQSLVVVSLAGLLVMLPALLGLSRTEQEIWPRRLCLFSGLALWPLGLSLGRCLLTLRWKDNGVAEAVTAIFTNLALLLFGVLVDRLGEVVFNPVLETLSSGEIPRRLAGATLGFFGGYVLFFSSGLYATNKNEKDAMRFAKWGMLAGAIVCGVGGGFAQMNSLGQFLLPVATLLVVALGAPKFLRKDTRPKLCRALTHLTAWPVLILTGSLIAWPFYSTHVTLSGRMIQRQPELETKVADPGESRPLPRSQPAMPRDQASLPQRYKLGPLDRSPSPSSDWLASRELLNAFQRGALNGRLEYPWRNYLGSMLIQNGQLAILSYQLNAWDFILYPAESWRDYRLEAQIRLQSAKVGLIVRYDLASGACYEFLVAQEQKSETCHESAGLWFLRYRLANDSQNRTLRKTDINVLAQADYPLVRDKVYTVQVSAAGNRLWAEIDGAPALYAEDRVGRGIQSGGVGLSASTSCLAPCIAFVSYLRVNELT